MVYTVITANIKIDGYYLQFTLRKHGDSESLLLICYFNSVFSQNIYDT